MVLIDTGNINFKVLISDNKIKQNNQTSNYNEMS